MKKNILIIAGEPSGDMRGGEVLGELKKLLPDVSFWGIGGDRMEREGVELIEHVRKLSIVGVWEAVKKLSIIREQYRNVIDNVRKRKPTLAILVDYPGFNLKLARFLHRSNIPVVYYIVPQVWAWGSWRIRSLKNYVDKALVLFDFEQRLLKEHGIDCEFVGHPLVDKAPSPITPDHPSTSLGTGELTIALLPGSRESEILNMLPTMLDAAEKIRECREDARFIVAENSNVGRALYDSALARHGGLSISRLTDDTFACLDRCDFAIVTSGTATLETAIMEKPMVIVYRTSPLTYVLARAFKRTPFIGLANIIAGKEIAPELLQKDLTPEKLSGKTLEIINDDSRMRQATEELRKVKHSLGEKGASRRAAEAISRLVDGG